MIDISKKDKGAVLAALYNNSRAQGMGILHFDPAPMSAGEGAAILSASMDQKYQRGYFDYLKGRVMKVDLSRNSFSPHLYDRDLGNGAALRVVNSLPDVK